MILRVNAWILQVLLLKSIYLVVGILADWWNLSLDIGVLIQNLNLWILYLLECKNAGLSVEHRLRVILTLSMALVWLLGLVTCVGLTIRILPVVH